MENYINWCSNFPIIAFINSFFFINLLISPCGWRLLQMSPNFIWTTELMLLKNLCKEKNVENKRACKNFSKSYIFQTYNDFFKFYRWWWRMLETKFVGDSNFFRPYSWILVTILVTKIPHRCRSPTFKRCHHCDSPTSLFCHQFPQIVLNFKSPTLRCHQHHCRRKYN